MKEKLKRFFSFASPWLSRRNWTRIALSALAIFAFVQSLKNSWTTEQYSDAVSSDGVGYYSYLPATYIYHDYSFHFLDSLAPRYHGLTGSGNCGFCNTSAGKTVNKYFCGESIAVTPFFLCAHFIARISGLPADGYSRIYMIFLGLAAIFYSLLGLWCISRILHRMNIRDYQVAIILCAVFLGTNLYYYTCYAPSMTHAYSFAFVSLFVLQISLLTERYRFSSLFFSALAFGMIVILRPVNSLVLLSIPFIAGNLQGLKNLLAGMLRRPLHLTAAVLICTALIFIQLLYYKIQTGHWYVYAYGKEGFDFSNPHFFSSLFSYENGACLYSPFLFIALTGMFALLRENLFRFVSFLLFFIVFVWIISSWWAWTYSGALGMRPFIEYYVYFAMLAAILFRQLSVKKSAWLSVLVLLPLVLLVQVQTWQFRFGVIAWDSMTSEKYWRVFLRTGPQFNYISIDTPPPPVTGDMHKVFEKLIDFETQEDSMDWRSVKETLSVSGKKAVYYGEDDFHPPIWKHRLSELISDSILAKGNLFFEIRAKCRLENASTNARLVSDLQKDKEIFFYQETFLIHRVSVENEWKEFRDLFYRAEAPGKDDSWELYFTKTDGEIMYLDDLVITIWQR